MSHPERSQEAKSEVDFTMALDVAKSEEQGAGECQNAEAEAGRQAGGESPS